MNLDLSADHVAWDNTEPVTLLKLDRDGREVFSCALPAAKGQEITRREKSPSGGAYLGFERTWHLPARDIAEPNVGVSPGDVIEDEGATRWTVLTVRWSRLKNRWRAECVNLVLALGLRDTVAIERAVIAYDASGAAVKAFPPLGGRVLFTLAARVQEMSREIAEERLARYDKRRYEVIVDRMPTGLDIAEDRVAWTDRGEVRHLDITGLRNAERIDDLPVLECEARA